MRLPSSASGSVSKSLSIQQFKPTHRPKSGSTAYAAGTGNSDFFVDSDFAVGTIERLETARFLPDHHRRSKTTRPSTSAAPHVALASHSETETALPPNRPVTKPHPSVSDRANQAMLGTRETVAATLGPGILFAIALACGAGGAIGQCVL